MKGIHHYAKLNDHQVFCEHCGDIKTAPQSYGWYWRPYTVPYIQPSYPYWTWSTTTGYLDTATTDWGSTVGNVTKTWIETVTKDATPETPKTPTEKKIKGVADPDVKK